MNWSLGSERIRRGSRTCLDGIFKEKERTDTPARYFDIAVMKKLTENKQQQNSEMEYERRRRRQ